MVSSVLVVNMFAYQNLYINFALKMCTKMMWHEFFFGFYIV